MAKEFEPQERARKIDRRIFSGGFSLVTIWAIVAASTLAYGYQTMESDPDFTIRLATATRLGTMGEAGTFQLDEVKNTPYLNIPRGKTLYVECATKDTATKVGEIPPLIISDKIEAVKGRDIQGVTARIGETPIPTGIVDRISDFRSGPHNVTCYFPLENGKVKKVQSNINIQ